MKQNLTFYDFPQEALYFKQLCIFGLTRLLFKKLYIYVYIYIQYIQSVQKVSPDFILITIVSLNKF